MSTTEIHLPFANPSENSQLHRSANVRSAKPADRSVNPYLEGIFAPAHEQITATDLPVIGKLPTDLDGLFVRNGPNPSFQPKPTYHWFDGDGMLHGVRVEGGKASYLNRFVRTQSLEQAEAAGRSMDAGLNDGPIDFLKNIFRGVRAGGPEVFNKANTALVWHHGKLLALWEGGLPYEVRPEDLSTVGLETLGGAWKHAFTAHPKIDATTGELMFFGYSPFGGNVQCGVLDRTGRVVHTTSVSLPRSVMMHDCAITRHFTLLLDLPMVGKLWRPLVGRPIYRFQPECGARFGILPRHGDGAQINWFDVEPCYLFHVLNAWEEGKRVIVYGCRFEGAPSVLKKKRIAADELTLDSVMYRWEFNLQTGETKEGPIDDCPVEFPRVDDAQVGKQTRFGYATSLFEDSSQHVKFDLVAGTQIRHDCGAGRVAGEGVFVPRPCRTCEDDGYLVTLLHDQIERQSELVVLDAQAFDEPPLARVLLPQRVPAGFHGVWIDGDQM